MSEINTIGQPKTIVGRPEVKVGDTWNYLFILAEHESHGKGREVLCRCICGKKRSYIAHFIRRGSITSCGTCSRKKRPTLPYRRKSKYTPQVAAQRSLFTSYKNKARQAGRPFSLRFDQFCRLISAPCAYCGKGPASVHFRNRKTSHVSHQVSCVYNGIDRVNNSEGYTLDNAVPCCEICNRAKLQMSLPAFKAWIMSVYLKLGISAGEVHG